MSNNHSNSNQNIRLFLERIEGDTSGLFSKELKLAVILRPTISDIIGDNEIYISEFIVAKIRGKTRGNAGHPEITDEIFLNVPYTLNHPFVIYQDPRKAGKTKFIFIEVDKNHQIIVEICRIETGKSEINTIIPIGERTLKQLGGKLQAVFRYLR